nr:AAA family ATPase [uncultured Flavobacterium sp.]
MRLFDFIGLKNFRVFDHQNGILQELSAINLLTGTNNSGKSSLIKSLQMLKNSVSGSKTPFDLDLNQQQHLLGDFENVLSNPDNKNIEISLPFPFLGLTKMYAVFSYAVPEKSGSYKASLRKIAIIDMSDSVELFSFAYRKASKEEIAADLKSYEEEQQQLEKKNRESSKLSATERFFLPIDYMPPHSELAAYIDWTINAEKLRIYLTALLPVYQTYLKERDKEAFLARYDKKSHKTSLAISIFVNSLNSKNLEESWSVFLEKTIKDSAVLSGSKPIREYDFEGEDYFIPSYEIEEILFYFSEKILEENLIWTTKIEEKTISVISSCFDYSYKVLLNNISEIHFLSTIKEENSRIYIGTNNSPFVNLLKDYSALDQHTAFINKYLKAFEIGSRIMVDYEPKYQLLKVSIISDNLPPRDLVDFGYGIKQLVLILMQISVLAHKNKNQKQVYRDQDEYLETYYKHSLLLVEEPETNLHPKWQSLLAEMFAEANTKFNIQLIIETHSEYLIRKFQTLTADRKIESKSIKIFYLRTADKVTAERKQIETTFIEDDGSIDYSLFDGGFFDESHNLEDSLLNIQRDQFRADFEILKKNKIKDQQKIEDMQEQIQAYISKIDLGVYQTMIQTTFDTSKLESHTIIYLTSAMYLLNNTVDHTDFSPVIIQYGRALENELYSIFVNADPNEKWMLGIMQGSLEKFKFGTSSVSPCSNVKYPLVVQEFNSDFNTPMDLKIEMLDDLRKKRNGAAHAGSLKNKAEAIDFINKTNVFLHKWIDLKK